MCGPGTPCTRLRRTRQGRGTSRRPPPDSRYRDQQGILPGQTGPGSRLPKHHVHTADAPGETTIGMIAVTRQPVRGASCPVVADLRRPGGDRTPERELSDEVQATGLFTAASPRKWCLQFLWRHSKRSRPDSYVPAPETVVTRDPHVLGVMAGERAYKLKKPNFHLTRNIKSVRHQCGFGHRGKHTTCRPAKNEFPQPGMAVPAHDNEIGIRVGCI